MAFQKFSELYDKTNYIDSCRFWMMLKMKFKSEHTYFQIIISIFKLIQKKIKNRNTRQNKDQSHNCLTRPGKNCIE